MPNPVLLFHAFVILVLAAVYVALTVDGDDATLVLGALIAQVANSGIRAAAAVTP